MSPRRLKILKIVAYTVGGVAVLLTALLVAFRIALVRAPNYRAQVQSWVSERTKLSIQFSRMDARWRFYGPELVFDSAVVRSRDRTRVLVRANRVSVGFDVWTAIGTGRLAAGRITVEEPELQIVRTVDDRIEVVGQHELPQRNPNEVFVPDELPTGRIRVIDAQVILRDLKTGRGPWIVPGVSFDFRRSGSAMHIDGEADLPTTLGKSLRFTADTAGKLAEAASLDWRFSIDARSIDLAGWAQTMPRDWPAPRTGRGSFQLSGALHGARPIELALQLQFDRVALVLPEWQEPLPSVPKLEYRYVESDDQSDTESENDNATPDPDRSTDTQPADKQSSALASIEEKKVNAAFSATRGSKSPPTVDYSRVAFNLRLRHIEEHASDAWYVALQDLELSRPQSKWTSKSIAVTVTQTAAGGIDASAQADYVLLDNLWPLLAYVPESPRLALVRGLNAQGDIRDLQFKAKRIDAAAPLTFNVSGRCEALGLSPVAKFPGVEHFGGIFTASESGGQVNLSVRDGSLALPTILRTPLPVERIDGRINWQRETEGWRIVADNVQIQSPDGQAAASGSVFVPSDHSSPIVDIRAVGENLQARATPRYLPAGRLSPAALAWLDRAFVNGTVPHAEFQMRGPTRSFPFRDGSGLFLIQARVDGLTLDYQPGWMPATNLVVDAEFRNEGMSAQLRQGEVNGLLLSAGVGRIDDFKKAVLSLDATAEGDLAKALPYLQQSTVGPAIGSQFMALRGQGAFHAKTKLELPFKEIEHRKLTVDARITDATIALDSIDERATHVTGTLNVQDFTLKSLALRGAFLGGGVVVEGGADDRYYGRGAGMKLSANGTARGIELANLLHLPKSIRLGGAMQWKLDAEQTRHAPDAPAPRTVAVESDTKGLSIDLPAPVGKTADVARTLRFDVDAPDDDQILLHGALGDARALVRVAKDANGWHLDRGGLRLDSQAAALPAHEGLRLEGDIEKFVLDDWLKIKGDGSGAHTLSDFFRAANVRIGQLGFLGFTWSDVRAILQANEKAWRVDVAGRDIVGQLTIPFAPESGEPLRVALNKLNVGEHQSRGEGANANADPRDIPAIGGRVDELWLSGRRVGTARFELEKNAQGVLLKSGELRGQSFTATALGSWLENPGNTGSTSSVVIDVASTDVRETLRAFNFHDVISGKRANAHAELTWPGGIDEDLLARSSGKVGVEMADGQLLTVDPGAGRMLGLMSIAALPRRLALDFSDVTDKGFKFDTISGDFQLKNGDAFTDNLLVRGPAGETGIAGRTGLGEHNYELTAVVTGDIGGSLSVASTAVGGPVLGAAVLAFTRLFKEPLKGVTRRYYRIDGPWDNPVVERIDKDEAKKEEKQEAKPETKQDAVQTAPNAAVTEQNTPH